MSPEQAAATEPSEGRSAIYSLGSVLYEMLAGQPPFAGPTPQNVMAKLITEPAPAVVDVRRDVPPGVDRLLATAMAKDPKDRYATASQLASALADQMLLGKTGSSSMDMGTVRRARLSPRALAGIAAAIVVTTIAAWGVIRNRSARDNHASMNRI